LKVLEESLNCNLQSFNLRTVLIPHYTRYEFGIYIMLLTLNSKYF